jgi:hypothetical protein
MMTVEGLGKALKALYAALVSFMGMLSTILVGDTRFGQVTQGQWVSIALFSLVAGGGVYGLAGWSGPKINGAK